MARAEANILDTGDRVPRFELQLVSGKSIVIPDELGDQFTAIFFFRGYW